MSLGGRKLVVLGIPWDVDAEGLRQYMGKFGQLEDVIMIKDRATGRSRGFGYVTFALAEDAEKAVSLPHSLNGRVLEVKIATLKEDMKPSVKKVTRVFVARIPPPVTDEMFRSYFEKFGTLTDAYMPKDQISKVHRGIGFITFEHAESVDKVMAESHELAGSTIAVDRAAPKEETTKQWDRSFPGAYGHFGMYTNVGRYPHSGAPGFGAYDYPGSDPGNDLGNEGNHFRAVHSWVPPPPPPPPGGILGGPSLQVPNSLPSAIYASNNPPSAPNRAAGTKIFVGRLPPEATAEDLRRYFSNFGRILDVYVPKDAKKIAHRGFGFVTFLDEGAAEAVTLNTHELLGHQIAVDRAAPQDGAGAGFHNNAGHALPTLGAGGPVRPHTDLSGGGYGSFPGNLGFNSGWGVHGGVGPFTGDNGGPGVQQASRSEPRYRPY